MEYPLTICAGLGGLEVSCAKGDVTHTFVMRNIFEGSLTPELVKSGEWKNLIRYKVSPNNFFFPTVFGFADRNDQPCAELRRIGKRNYEVLRNGERILTIDEQNETGRWRAFERFPPGLNYVVRNTDGLEVMSAKLNAIQIPFFQQLFGTADTDVNWTVESTSQVNPELEEAAFICLLYLVKRKGRITRRPPDLAP